MADQITVVISNWRRPDNVRRLVQQYAAISEVAQVIIVDSAAGTAYGVAEFWQRWNTKIVALSLSEDLGLGSRFAAAALARTDAVLIVDDDIVLPDKTVLELFERWQTDPDVLHGLFGRNPAPDGKYTPATVHGDCQVVLTRAVMAHRRYFGPALTAVQDMVHAVGGEPWGNGEDIVLSHVVLSLTHRLNHAYPLPFCNRDAADRYSISVRYRPHETHRTRVVRWCRANLTNDAHIYQASAT